MDGPSRQQHIIEGLLKNSYFISSCLAETEQCITVPGTYLDHKKQFYKTKFVLKNLDFFNVYRSSTVVMSSFVIEFYYGFDASSVFGSVSGSVINYGSGSAKAKSSCGSGFGSAAVIYGTYFFLQKVKYSTGRVTSENGLCLK